ncbi:MAG: CRTAC1 family protein [Bacteroidales bacterium]|nr:CRTAC1 family protein [Bacteroidales bacterium]
MNVRNGTAFCLLCSICLFILFSCNLNRPRFTEVSSDAGIDFMYNFGDYTYENILESSGSGVTVFDYDGDGWMDLYMMNGTWLEGISDDQGRVFENTPNRLYHNQGDGTFKEVSEQAGVDDRHWSMAAGSIDLDGDGDQDLYLLNYGPNIFYRNNGDGTFTDITEKLGLAGPDSLNGFEKWSVGVSFWDYNRDGRLDAFVGNFLAFDPEYVSPTTPELMPHPSEYAGQASMMYRQQRNGTFREVTAGLGLLYPDSKCMGLTVYDYDRDGDLDMFQGNDHQANFMFRNEGGRFSEVGVEIGVAVNSHGQTTGSMHGAIGDVDGDGLIDLLVPDLRYGALYRNLGNGTFEDITEQSGIAGASAGKGQWASALFDYDNDGDPDLFSANGTAEELILQYPLLMENDGKGNFTDIGISDSPYFSEKRSGRAAATWDYDNDGDLDIIVSHVDLKANAVLLRNNCNNQNHWIGLTLEGKNGPAAAIGATVVVHQGEKRAVYINQWTTTYLSNSDPRLHIGLGGNPEIDRLEINWSDGTREVYPGPAPDRYITFRQGYGIVE